MRLVLVWLGISFNPRPRKEATKSSAERVNTENCFNPRPRKEATSESVMPSISMTFQSTPP